MASIKIPVVDIGPYHDPASTSQQRQAAASALIAACHELGFVAIKNHGIPLDSLQDAFSWSKKFFNLSHDDKMKAPHPAAAMPHRGYSAPGLEKVYSKEDANDSETNGESGRLSIRKVSDYKESFEIGSETNPDQQNIWLPEDILPGFKKFTTEFYWACNEAGNVILRAMADGMGLEGEERDSVLEMNGQHQNQLRLLHYPAIDTEKLDADVLARMPAHTDWATITLLWQDDVGGLELQNPETGQWVSAEPTEGVCVLNVCDFFERLTNGYLKSAAHRVSLPPNRTHDTLAERFSIPYFIGPQSRKLGKCLGTFVAEDNPAKFDTMTFGEYAAWRMKHSY